MLPKISIIVPSFNAGATLRRCLESLIGQDYENLELICVDGNSTDDSIAMLQAYHEHIDTLIVEDDRCQAEALNKGFAKATGEIYGWLCADDELAPGTLNHVGSFFDENPGCPVLTGGCVRKFETGEAYETVPEDNYYSHLFLKNTIEQPSTFWRRDVQERVGPLSESLKYAFDWEYWCRMKAAGFDFARTNQVYSIYYFSDSNLTSTGGTKIAREMYKIVRDYGPYKGRLAWAYAFLYRIFDLRGYYDSDEQQAKPMRYVFHVCLRVLYALFDRDSINTYNWNFASRQERGKGW